MANARSYAGPDRRRARPSPLYVGLAVAGVAAVAFATLCPIGLRPHVGSAGEERFGAYFMLGALIAIAAGRRGLAALVLVVALAFAFEAGQLAIPGRHAVLSDALVKALGGVFGSAGGQVFFALRRWVVRVRDLAAIRTGGMATPSP